MENILLSPIELTKLLDSVRIVVREEINAARLKEMEEEKLLSPSEVLKLLSISRPTLIKWSKKGSLKEYRVDSKIYYKKSEVMDSLLTLEKYKTNYK